MEEGLVFDNLVDGANTEMLGLFEPANILFHLGCGDHLHGFGDFFDGLDGFHSTLDDFQAFGCEIEVVVLEEGRDSLYPVQQH